MEIVNQNYSVSMQARKPKIPRYPRTEVQKGIDEIRNKITHKESTKPVVGVSGTKELQPPDLTTHVMTARTSLPKSGTSLMPSNFPPEGIII